MPATRRIQIAALFLLLDVVVWMFAATHLAPAGIGPTAAKPVGRLLGLPPEPTSTVPNPTTPSGGRASLDVYRGLGTWIDIYDVAWRHPGTAIRRMRARGVETLYLETSNFSRGRMMVFPDGLRRFLDAAHRNGISVVAWYLPGLRDLALDVHRSLGAIRYRTPLGNAFDSFALDIESDAVARPVHRTRRLLSLSARLRAAVDPGYALGAIIPSPRRLQADVLYWPHFPYQRLADVYDVFLPMTYFTFRVSGRFGARWYTAGNIDIIRQQTGDWSVPIHVIGGIGGDATEAETAGFVDAVRGRRAIGGSYYTFPITRPGDWSKLERLRSIR
ncbi:MAG: hypothetical protein E6G52_07625 [Actinobacteria bacterium]|nr:MAG: hypothetical protein E6G52_07625 [Actinomycetota bacterium]